MKKTAKILYSIVLSFVLFSFSFAQYGRRGSYGNDPVEIFENIVGESNEGHDKIQETALDGITDKQGSYGSSFKITNTLDYIRQNIDPYIQWTAYVGLVLSTIGLIVAGFLMVTGSINKAGDFSKQKTRILNAILGTFFISGFYLLLKLLIGIINSIIGNGSGGTGF